MKCPKCQTDNPSDSTYCKSCATLLASPGENQVSFTKTLHTPSRKLAGGSTFAGRYQVLEELGKGGMGKVYKVLDTEIQEDIALKLLNPEIAADEEMIERFRNELKFARKITHKNVCRMHDLGKEEETYYITMEYVDGEDLKTFIKKNGRLSEEKVVSFTKQVCQGLAEAHALGVVHRDLKPQNIMIDKKGNVRIMDFGIARSLETKGMTVTGMIIGTPDYMSPEQVEGEEADKRSDIYSLGVILYEMVTGRVPFEGETALSVALKHKSKEPAEPRKFNGTLSESLNSVILKCMAKERGDRYQNAEELLSDLSNIEKGLPTAERVLPRKKPLALREIVEKFRSTKLIVPVAVFIALVLAAAIIWRFLPRKEAVPLAPPGKPSLAVMYFKNITQDESVDYLRSGLAELLIADLLQSKYISVLSGDRLYKILSEMDQLEAKTYSSDVLEEVAARGGVNHIIQGTFAKAGNTFRVNVMLQKAGTGEFLASEGVEGTGDESIFSMVDELTSKIKTHFNLSEEEVAGDLDSLVGKITTSSTEAYKSYLEGTQHAYKGENREALQSFKKAVAADPEFAMAYRRMSMMCYNLRLSAESWKYMKKAFSLIDTERVSERERLLIMGNYYGGREKERDKGLEAFNKVLELYPDSKDTEVRGVRNILGMAYNGLEQWDEAIEQFEWLIQNKYEGYQPYVNVTASYMAKGMYEKAKDVIENFQKDFEELPITHWELAVNYLCQGKFELAHAEADKSLSLDPEYYRNFYTKGDIYLCQGNLAQAEKEYQRLLASEERPAHVYGWRRLGALYLLQGRFSKAEDQLRQGIELAESLGQRQWKSQFNEQLAYLHLQTGNYTEALKNCDEIWSRGAALEKSGVKITALFLKGHTFLEMNSVGEVQKAADEIKVLVEEGFYKKDIRFHFHLMGEIELKKENFSGAVEYFNRALSYIPYEKHGGNAQALFINSLALAYYRSGDREKALEEYERILTLTTGRVYYGDIYARNFYMLGKICEQKGWKGKAIENYEKFLDLWKDADPGLPEVEDAKKRLAGLK